MKYTFNIPAGSYAVAIFHDENSDGVCNTNFLGIPEEGYGFSNNIKPLLSAPTFDEAKVSVKKDTEIEIHLIYWFHIGAQPWFLRLSNICEKL